MVHRWTLSGETLASQNTSLTYRYEDLDSFIKIYSPEYIGIHTGIVRNGSIEAEKWPPKVRALTMADALDLTLSILQGPNFLIQETPPRLPWWRSVNNQLKQGPVLLKWREAPSGGLGGKPKGWHARKCARTMKISDPFPQRKALNPFRSGDHFWHVFFTMREYILATWCDQALSFLGLPRRSKDAIAMLSW